MVKFNKFVAKQLWFLVIILLIVIIFIEISIIALGQNYRYKKSDRDTKDISLTSNCNSVGNYSQKAECWNQLIITTLKKDGLEHAFKIIRDLYQSDEQFANDCHAFIHTLGQQAYQLFSQGKDFNLPPETSYCGYGFYHGFMETLLLAKNDLKLAGQFCEQAQKQVGGTNDSKGACYHGIGHGLVDDHNRTHWINEDALVKSGLHFCKVVAPDETLLARCASGIFNVMALNYTSGKLTINKQDPLRYCTTLTRRAFKQPCFEEMNTSLMTLTNNDFSKAAKFAENIEDEEYAKFTLQSLGLVAGKNLKEENYLKAISSCRKLQDRLQPACIKGFVGGIIEGGQPNQQDINALNFCKSNLLTEKERNTCYQDALRLLTIYIPTERYKQICKNIAQKYKNDCLI